MEGVTAYSPVRNAWTYRDGVPVVAHPPCRSWGQIRWRAQPTLGERNLAAWCLNWVRIHGGVLEHPRGSTLLTLLGIRPGMRPDRWGGYCIEVAQFHFGHEAEKLTWLYIVGCPPWSLPKIPVRKGQPPKVVQAVLGLRKGMPGWRPEISKAARELTPRPFAEWLVEVARRCVPQGRHRPSPTSGPTRDKP